MVVTQIQCQHHLYSSPQSCSACLLWASADLLELICFRCVTLLVPQFAIINYVSNKKRGSATPEQGNQAQQVVSYGFLMQTNPQAPFQGHIPVPKSINFLMAWRPLTYFNY